MDDRLPKQVDIALSGLVAGQSIRIAITSQNTSNGGDVSPAKLRANSLAVAADLETSGPSSASGAGLSRAVTALRSDNLVSSLKVDRIYRCVLSSPRAEPNRSPWFGLRTASKWSRRVSSVYEIYPTLRDVSSSLLAACAAAVAVTW